MTLSRRGEIHFMLYLAKKIAKAQLRYALKEIDDCLKHKQLIRPPEDLGVGVKE